MCARAPRAIIRADDSKFDEKRERVIRALYIYRLSQSVLPLLSYLTHLVALGRCGGKKYIYERRYKATERACMKKEGDARNS